MNSEEAGNPDGDPMVMVHGFLSSNAQWDLNREALGAHHRLIMAELFGHGGSDAPGDPEAYGPQRVIAELERVRVEHGVERWWVCGQSLGGAICVKYALVHPQRVRGLILTNSRAMFGIGRRGVDNAEARATEGITSLRELRVHPINAKRLSPEVRNRLVEAADAIPFHAVDHVTTQRDAWRSVDEMPQLDMPVLLVNGRWESAFQPKVDVARAQIPDLEVVDLEGGHAINIERAAEFNAAVLDFVSRRGGAR